jgi:hypothetical protein
VGFCDFLACKKRQLGSAWIMSHTAVLQWAFGFLLFFFRRMDFVEGCAPLGESIPEQLCGLLFLPCTWAEGPASWVRSCFACLSGS